MASGNIFAPNKWQTITWTDIALLSNTPIKVSVKFYSKYEYFLKMHLKMSPEKGGHFVPTKMC